MINNFTPLNFFMEKHPVVLVKKSGAGFRLSSWKTALYDFVDVRNKRDSFWFLVII